MFSCCFLLWTPLAHANIDSLIQELDAHIIHTDEASVKENLQRCLAICKLSEKKEQFEEVIRYAKKGLDLVEDLGDQTLLAEFLFYLAYSYERTNNNVQALERYFEIINHPRIDTLSNSRVMAMSQVANTYRLMGNYEKAYEYQMQAIGAHERNGDTINIARSTYMLGSIFFYQKRYNEALKLYKNVEVLSRQYQVDRLTYAALGAIGSTYELMGDDEESLFYNQQALDLAKKINLKSGIAYALGNIGVNHLKMGNCRAAEDNLKKSIAMKNELNDAWGVSGGRLYLSDVYLQCGQQHKVTALLDDVMTLVWQMGAKNRQLEVYERLIKHYEQTDELQKALFYSKKFIALKDTILSEKTLDEMGQSKQRYELQKKEHEITMLKTEMEILNVSQENQRLQKYIYVASIVIFILISIWFFSRLKMQRRINTMLEEKNDLLNSKNEEIDLKNKELDGKNRELDVKNKQLESSNEDLQSFAYVASHDLKEPLRMIHSYTSLLKRRYNHQLDNSGKEFMHYIVDAVDRMKILLDDLLDYSRSGTQIPDKLVDVNDTMIMVEANLRHRLQTCGGQLIVHHDHLPAVRAHSTQLMQLLQNLISNGLKFRGEQAPVVTLDCMRQDDQYLFSIKDNGIGISQENLDKVFEMFRRLHTREEYEGTGIGLATCKRIVANMGGDIWVESTVGEGSTFFFSVPVAEEEEMVGSI